MLTDADHHDDTKCSNFTYFFYRIENIRNLSIKLSVTNTLILWCYLIINHKSKKQFKLSFEDLGKHYYYQNHCNTMIECLSLPSQLPTYRYFIYAQFCFRYWIIGSSVMHHESVPHKTREINFNVYNKI